jgi:hypothetical protein
MELRKFLVIVTALLIVGLILLTWFIPLNDDFQDENPYWNGISDIINKYPIHPLQSLADLPPSPQSTTLILIPYQNSTAAELDQLNRFVSQGGRLILADDYGYGNQILGYLGLETRFAGQTLIAPMIHYKTRQFPEITHLEPNPLTPNVTSLVFNHATCLIDVNADETVASSSTFSFLDLNDNGVADADEPEGPLPVISQHTLGSGVVILIADPSLFINGMEKMKGNDTFINNILASAGGDTYFDRSHLEVSNLQQTKSWLKEARSFVTNPAGTLVLVVVVIVAALIPVWYKKKQP